MAKPGGSKLWPHRRLAVTNQKMKTKPLFFCATDTDLDSVVCSSDDCGAIRCECGGNFIRPEGSDASDQKRIMTIKNGATHLGAVQDILDDLVS